MNGLIGKYYQLKQTFTSSTNEKPWYGVAPTPYHGL